MQKSPSKPVVLTLTCNLEVLFIEIVFCRMYHLERQLWYLHLLKRHYPCNLLSPGAKLNMNIEENLEATPWRHRWRHHNEKTFLAWFGTIFSYLWPNWSCVKYFKISSRHFELATNFFTGSYTGSWTHQKDSHSHIRHFELLIDALDYILTEIYQFKNLTYFLTWWRHQ